MPNILAIVFKFKLFMFLIIERSFFISDKLFECKQDSTRSFTELTLRNKIINFKGSVESC